MTINRTTGAVQVTAKDGNGKVVTLNGSDVKGDPGGDAVFGWIRCAWNFVTTLGRDRCSSAKASAPMSDVPEHWDREQERKKNAAFLSMMNG